jgi:hypothetical protein
MQAASHPAVTACKPDSRAYNGGREHAAAQMICTMRTWLYSTTTGQRLLTCLSKMLSSIAMPSTLSM